MNKLSLKPVLLCGGSGTRLWPLSRSSYPKQFADFGLGKSLFQISAERALNLCNSPILAVCGQEHRFYVENELAELASDKVLVEPCARDTAPAVALACLRLVDEDPVVVMMPCDHHMPDISILREALADAAALAEQGFLVQLGIQPRYAATGYGYIELGEPLACGYRVKQMREKPDQSTADAFVAQGLLWNSGMLVFKPSVMLEELSQYCPDTLTAVSLALANSRALEHSEIVDESAYAKATKRSLDFAVLEKTSKLACVPYAGHWDDLGSWPSISEMHEPDGDGNVAVGDVILEDCKDAISVSTSRMVCLQGLQDVVVVETPDAVYVGSREASEDIKKIVTRLDELGREESKHPHRVRRPWGWYESLAICEGYQSKRLCVKAGAAISLQYHDRRSEHWVVVRGTATVTKGDDTFQLMAGESVFIPKGVVHRLAAANEDVLVIEVQTGDYLGEDDIVRLEDKYSR